MSLPSTDGTSPTDAHASMMLEVDRKMLSTRLFGRGSFLPVAVWIRQHASGDVFYQGQVAKVLSLHTTAVGTELALLADLGLLTRITAAAGDPRRLFTADPTHPLWGVVDATEAALTTPPATEAAVETAVAVEVAPDGDLDADRTDGEGPNVEPAAPVRFADSPSSPA